MISIYCDPAKPCDDAGYCKNHQLGHFEFHDNQTAGITSWNEYLQGPAPVVQGWQCPVCGGGVAPTTARCPCRDLHLATAPATTVTLNGGVTVKPRKRGK